MKILFFGDIIGRPGREAVKKILPKWKKKFAPDLIIANGENLAHGAGVTDKSLKEILGAGVEIVTSGNHIFDKKEGWSLLNEKDIPLIRPANWPPLPYGKGYRTIEIGIKKVLVINLNGRLFFKESLDCPFRKADEILEQIEDEEYSAIIVDFHAEATSEKAALGHYLDGRVSAVLGTHTHIPTADEKILPKGTAYISDVGMVGPYDSVISFDKDGAVRGWITQIFKGVDLAEGPVEVDAVLVEIDTKTKMAKKIKRLQETIAID
jgi:hypothetical protein